MPLPLIVSQILPISAQILIDWESLSWPPWIPSQNSDSVNCSHHPCGNKPGPASLKTVVSLQWDAAAPGSKACVSYFSERLTKIYSEAAPCHPRPLGSFSPLWEHSPASAQPGLSTSFSLATCMPGAAISQLWWLSFPQMSVQIVVGMVCVCNLEIASSKPWLCHSWDMWPGQVTSFPQAFFSPHVKGGVDNNHFERLLKDLMRVWKK